MCPCGSGNKYKKCCQPFHKGKIAKTALELMRSRYTAYAVALPKYIIKTTHKENQDFTSNIQQWEDEILEFCRNFTFEKLTILEHSNQNDTVAFVKFEANISLQSEDHTFIEHSRFEKVDKHWFYHSAK